MILSLDDIEAYKSAVVKAVGKRFDFRIGGQSGLALRSAVCGDMREFLDWMTRHDDILI